MLRDGTLGPLEISSMGVDSRLGPLVLFTVLLLQACSSGESQRTTKDAIRAAAAAHADNICLTSEAMDRESAQTLADIADLMAEEPGPKDDSTLAAIQGASLARQRGCVD